MYEQFIQDQIKKIKSKVGKGIAVSALSGGVDSSVVTLLGHKALGDKLKVIFVDNGLMRENEPESVVSIFKKLGIKVEIINAKEKFLNALKGIEDPEEKRKIIKDIFYQDIFESYRKKVKTEFVLQGTILTDIEETRAGIKTQHNVDVEAPYTIIEPLAELRKNQVRQLAKELSLPESIYKRIPFLGPALAGRIIGEVTAEKLELIRKATAIVEQELKESGAFQYLAILHKDKVTGIREKKRELGFQIEVRCFESLDAREAQPTELSYNKLTNLAKKLTSLPEIVSVTYNITSKPPSTIEAV